MAVTRPRSRARAVGGPVVARGHHRGPAGARRRAARRARRRGRRAPPAPPGPGDRVRRRRDGRRRARVLPRAARLEAGRRGPRSAPRRRGATKLGELSIADVAPFLRAPAPGTAPPTAASCCSRTGAATAIAVLARPVDPALARHDARLGGRDAAQMVYVLVARASTGCPATRAASAHGHRDPPARAGAPCPFRFPDKDVRTLFDLQARQYPGALASTTHFCELPRAVTWAFRLCKPFMAASDENMKLRPDFGHLLKGQGARDRRGDATRSSAGAARSPSTSTRTSRGDRRTRAVAATLAAAGEGRAFDARWAADADEAAMNAMGVARATRARAARATPRPCAHTACCASAAAAGACSRRRAGRRSSRCSRRRRARLAVRPSRPGGNGAARVAAVAAARVERVAARTRARRPGSSAAGARRPRPAAGGCGGAVRASSRARGEYLFAAASPMDAERWVARDQRRDRRTEGRDQDRQTQGGARAGHEGAR